MRVLLVGNYALDDQASMLRYADMLCHEIALCGHQVEIIQPQPVFGRLFTQRVLCKWLGYIDKYVLFPPKLRARSAAFDVVHVCDHSNSMYLPHTGSCPTSITCHDLLAIASAQGRYLEQKISFTGKLQQRWILKHLVAARNVVCVSSNTAHELAALSQGAPQNVSIIPNPLIFHDSPAPQEDVLRLRNRLGFAAEDRYLFHIGGNQWYKNRFGVLRIFQLLSDIRRSTGAPGLHLVMAGKAWTQQMRDFVKTNQLQTSVIELVGPSNEDLRSLYSGATALLFPSLYEGFGWPLIEAQSCGCPVITSNRPPMTEVAGESTLYIDPANESAAATLIAENLDQLHLLREAGFRNARRFGLDQIIPAYEKFFTTIAQGKTLQTTTTSTPQPEIVTKRQEIP